MKRKVKYLSILGFFISGLLFSQEENPIYIKANASLIPLGLVNVGAEIGLSEHYTMQGDIFVSPWKSFFGNHARVGMGHLEGRYYFSEAFKKWYLGINAGVGVFDLTKWNYKDTNQYQRGFNYMVGASVGYQFLFNDKWNLDVFVGGGMSQAFYHGYDGNTGQRYDSAEKWNKSGEWIPYRGGLMLSYKIK